MQQLTIDSTIKRINKDIIITDLGGEKVILDMKTSDYIHLNDIGTVIWERIEQEVKVKKLCHQLQEDFTVSAEQCKLDTLAFLTELLQFDLIEIQY